jgi:hypothetical protein
VEAEMSTSVGTVLGAGIEAVDGDRVTVVVAVNQQLTTAGAEPRTEAGRLRMTLIRSDGQWLIAGVDRL